MNTPQKPQQPTKPVNWFTRKLLSLDAIAHVEQYEKEAG